MRKLISDIPLSDIGFNPVQPSGRVSNVKELSNSIQASGLVNPILICNSLDSKHKYTIGDGHRRFTAMLHLGWESCPFAIYDDEADPIQLFSVSNTFTKKITTKQYTDTFMKGGLIPNGLAKTIINLSTQHGKGIIKYIQNLDISVSTASRLLQFLKVIKFSSTPEFKLFLTWLKTHRQHTEVFYLMKIIEKNKTSNPALVSRFKKCIKENVKFNLNIS